MLHNKVIAALFLCMVLALGTNMLIQAGAVEARVADAAMNGDLTAVRNLLKQGADVNAAQGDGMTALHWAVFKDNADMAKTLVSAGANVSATTRINGMTPLFFAAQNGQAAMIDILVKAGAKPNAPLVTGVTPLMIAAKAGNPDAVKVLLDNGADANAKENARGETALMFAAAANRAAAIQVLLQSGANASLSTKVIDITAKNAAARGQAAAAQAQVAAAQPAQPGQPAAAGRGGRGRGNGGGGNMDEERPPLVDFQGGMTPLLFAARQGHIEAAKALLEGGAKVNEVSPGDKTSPLLIASVNGKYDLAMYLLGKGADPTLASTAGATPLYTAVNVKWAPKSDYPQPDTRQQRTSYLDFMTALLDRGADPNARLKLELWYSSYNFDLSQVNAAGATPFWRASQASDVPAMKLLLERGANPFIKTSEEVSPLHVAAGAGVHGNDEITATGSWFPGVKFLVDVVHADVNEGDGKGLTALHHAAARGDNETILYLVSKGADVKAVARSGQSTADMANGPVQRLSPIPATVALLVKLGARNNNRCVTC